MAKKKLGVRGTLILRAENAFLLHIFYVFTLWIVLHVPYRGTTLFLVRFRFFFFTIFLSSTSRMKQIICHETQCPFREFVSTSRGVSLANCYQNGGQTVVAR